MGNCTNRNERESVFNVSIYDLSDKALEVLIEKGIFDYIMSRSKNKIYKLVLYGKNAEFIKNNLNLKYDFYSEIWFRLDESGVHEGIWHLDADDLVYLYYKGILNNS